jgi:hypothetical protein
MLQIARTGSLSAPRILANASKEAPLKSPPMVHSMRNTPGNSRSVPAPSLSDNKNRVQDGGWLFKSWRPSAAGIKAMGPLPQKQASLGQKLVSAFNTLRGTDTATAQAASKAKRRAPPPPVPAKPDGLAAEIKRRQATQQNAQRIPPADMSSMQPSRTAPPPPPIAPLLGQMTVAPPALTRGSSLDSAIPPPQPTIAPIARSQSEDGGRAALLEALRMHGGVDALRRKTVELSSTGTATPDAATPRTPMSALEKAEAMGGINILKGATLELQAALVKRGKRPATHVGPEPQSPKSVAAGSRSDSGTGSLANSTESLTNSVGSSSSWTYRPSVPDRNAPDQQEFQRELQKALLARAGRVIQPTHG